MAADRSTAGNDIAFLKARLMATKPAACCRKAKRENKQKMDEFCREAAISYNFFLLKPNTVFNFNYKLTEPTLQYTQVGR